MLPAPEYGISAGLITGVVDRSFIQHTRMARNCDVETPIVLMKHEKRKTGHVQLPKGSAFSTTLIRISNRCVRMRPTRVRCLQRC